MAPARRLPAGPPKRCRGALLGVALGLWGFGDGLCAERTRRGEDVEACGAYVGAEVARTGFRLQREGCIYTLLALRRVVKEGGAVARN